MVKRKLKYGRRSLKAEAKAAARRKNNTNPIVSTKTLPIVNPTGKLQDTVQEIVVRGSFHQGDTQFSDISRGRQCTANAAFAIATSHFIALTSWTKNTIDDVLLGGDRLYIDSISSRNVPDGAELNREFLRVIELNPCLELLHNKVNLLIDERICTDGNLIQDLDGFPNLRNGLNSFFSEHACGILTTRGISLAIFKACGFFWIFDSHARGPNGRYSSQDSVACLIKSTNIDRIYDVLECNLSLASISTTLTDCQYTITPIYVLFVASEHDNVMVSQPYSNLSQQVLSEVAINTGEKSTYLESSQLINNNLSSITAIDVPLKRKQPDQAGKTFPKKKKVQLISIDGNESNKNGDQPEKLLPKPGTTLPSTPTVIVENWHKVEHEFHAAIWKFADNTCNICNKLFYKVQLRTFIVTDIARAVLPPELKDYTFLIICNRCETTIKKGKCPTQAYWNAMYLDPVPEVIKSLTDIEKRLISMVIPFIKIIKLGGRFGQYGFKGQAVLFAQDVDEVVEQLPLSLTSAGIAIVCERLENVSRVREFQVDVEKLWSALIWLKENNPLYRNVHIDYANTNFDLTQICQITNESAEINNVSEKARPSEGMKEIKGNRQILRGSFHQGDEKFSAMSRGRECTAIAAVAIVMSCIQLLPFWTKYTVDTVLINGDRLYTESISKRNVHQKIGVDSNYITADELHRRIELLGNVCNFVIDDKSSVDGHVDKDDPKAGFRKLSSGLDIFFSNQPHGILMINNMFLAVFKAEDHFWMFDSNSRSPNGRKAKHGVACLMQFETIDSLFKLLKCNLTKFEGKKFSGQYSLIPVSVFAQLDTCIHSTPLNTNIPSDSESMDENPIIMTSILRPIDECVPQVESIVRQSVDVNGASMTNVPLRTLHRKTAPPLQMYVERRAEELAWFYLFPFGRNGLHEPTRKFSITALDYCQARIMSASKRFQRNDYLFYALSVMEYYRARQNVGVCLRLRQGDIRPEGLVQNLYLNMRGLRGSDAYWHTACSDLVAMVRNLGPPTWFVTLSCNDLNWKDMLTACLIAAGRGTENPDNLQWEDKMELIEQNPVTLSRQFMVRLHAMMRILKRNDNLLGGKLVDYWWRIEFQNRGSPHLHMLCWNEGVPAFETPEGIAVIDKVISCDSRPPNEKLAQIVQRVQIHHHSSTCYKNRPDGLCRFSFPRQCSESTKILDADETIRNKGRFCVLKRALHDELVNNYNAQILLLWSGNMDIQPCGNVIAIAYYIAKYAAKGEPQDVGQAVREAIRKVQRFGGDVGKQLFAVSMAILRHRQVSAPECAFRLCHLKLRDSTRKVVFVNTCRPDERYRMLRCDGREGEVHVNIFDRYISRPENLEELSLAEFAVQYDTMSNLNNSESEDLGDYEVYADPCEPSAPSTIIRLQNGFRMKKRRKNAILKVRHYTQAGNREGYFYSYLVAHVPFRDEKELIGDYESAELAFNAKHHLLKPLQPGHNAAEFQYLERELQQVIAQVLALGEFETHDHREPNLRSEINDQVEAIVDGYEA